MKRKPIKKTIVGHTANRTKRKRTMSAKILIQTIYDTHFRHHTTEYIGQEWWWYRHPQNKYSWPGTLEVVLALRHNGQFEINYGTVEVRLSHALTELVVSHAECLNSRLITPLADPECFTKSSTYFKTLLSKLCEHNKSLLSLSLQTSKEDLKNMVLK